MKLESKYLEQFKRENRFVDIYTDYFDESNYGYVVDFNDEFILLEQFNDIGKTDGIGIIKRANVTRIRWEGNEISTTHKFAQVHPRMTQIGAIQINSMEEILKSIQKIFGYVNIYIQNIDTGMCIIGEIIEIDSESIAIHEFGTFSTLDRQKLIISLNEITKVEAGGPYEANLIELYR